jgi:hypothetical protein
VNSYIMLNLLEMKVRKSILSACIKNQLLSILKKDDLNSFDLMDVIEITSMYGIMKNTKSQLENLIYKNLGEQFKITNQDSKKSRIECDSKVWIIYHDLQESWLIDLLVELMEV